MMIIGGLQPNASKTDCDVPVIGGQHNMFLGQENMDYMDAGTASWWHAPYDNVTGYRVPDQIREVIGGEYVSRPVNYWCTILTSAAPMATPLSRPLRVLGQLKIFRDCLHDGTRPSPDL
jgi:hypothetical protein